MKYLGRQQLLSREIDYPDILHLKYSKHATERLLERTTGELILAPQYLRISKDNIYTGKVKGRRLLEAVVRIEYKKGVWMFLALLPQFSLVKTIYFRNAEEITTKQRNERAKEIRRDEENIKISLNIEELGQGGLGKNDSFIRRVMGKFTFTKKMLELWDKHIWRK